MNDYYTRINEVSIILGFSSVNDFAKKGLGYKSSEKLNRLKKEGSRPSAEIMEDISNKFENINLNWLITGKGQMTLNEESIKQNSEKTLSDFSKLEILEYLAENIDSFRKFALWKALMLKSENERYKEIEDMLEEFKRVVFNNPSDFKK